MDKNFLYKLPKDVLVELVCKSFNNISIKELGELYRNKCIDEIDKYKEILNKVYRIEDLKIIIGTGIICVLTDNWQFKIDILDYTISDKNDKWVSCRDLQDLLEKIHEFFSEKFAEEKIIRIMNTIQKIITTYNDKKEAKKYIRNNNLYTYN